MRSGALPRRLSDSLVHCRLPGSRLAHPRHEKFACPARSSGHCARHAESRSVLVRLENGLPYAPASTRENARSASVVR